MARRRTRNRVTFTTRGSSLLAAGAATGAGSFLLGETDLLRVAIALFLLCLLCWLYLRVARIKPVTRHEALPDEASVDTPIDVRVHTTFSRRRRATELVCEDQTSAGLSDPPALVIDDDAGREVVLRYRTIPQHRGVHTIGPLTTKSRDPFGLVTSTMVARESIDVVGLPRTYAVNRAWITLSHGAILGTEQQAERGSESEPDVTVREHQPTDGLRRVHWRSSARLGRLMSRQDEPHGEDTSTIVLDNRIGPHRSGTFEIAVEIVASIGRALLQNGHRLQLRTATGEVEAPHQHWSAPTLLRHLAVIEQTSASAALIDPALIRAAMARGGLFLIITDGSELPEDLYQLAARQSAPARAFVIARSGVSRPVTAQRLRAHGWQVTDIRVGQGLAEVLANRPANAAVPV